MKHEDLIHRLRSRAMIEAPTDNEPDTRAAFEDVPEIAFEELAEIAALLNEAADALEVGDTLVSPAPADPRDAAVPLAASELDELERRLEANEPQIREHTRVWALVAIRQLRKVVAPPPPAVDLELKAHGPNGYKPQAKRQRERATMNILTCEEPYPSVTKRIVRQLLSALEGAEREIERLQALAPESKK